MNVPPIIIPNFRPKCSKSIPDFRPKRLKNHTLWGGTYYIPDIGENPRGHLLQLDETCQSVSNSNCNFENVWHSIPVKPTQPKSRDTTTRNLALFPGEIIMAVWTWAVVSMFSLHFKRLLIMTQSLILSRRDIYTRYKQTAKSLDIHSISNRGRNPGLGARF